MLEICIAAATTVLADEPITRRNVVTASRIESPLAEAPANVTVITAEQISRTGAQSLVDVFDREPASLLRTCSATPKLRVSTSGAMERLPHKRPLPRQRQAHQLHRLIRCRSRTDTCGRYRARRGVQGPGERPLRRQRRCGRQHNSQGRGRRAQGICVHHYRELWLLQTRGHGYRKSEPVLLHGFRFGPRHRRV